MSFRARALHELRAVALTTLFFVTWLGGLILFKNLTLESYHLKPSRLTLALIEATLLAKVVLMLERVPLGSWIRSHPRVIDVVLRSVLYGLGAFTVLVLEKAFETRHEFGGFGRAVTRVFHHPDMPHVWANTLCIASALLVFNVLTVMRRLCGAPTMFHVFFVTPSAGTDHAPAERVPDERPGVRAKVH